MFVGPIGIVILVGRRNVWQEDLCLSEKPFDAVFLLAWGKAGRVCEGRSISSSLTAETMLVCTPEGAAVVRYWTMLLQHRTPTPEMSDVRNNITGCLKYYWLSPCWSDPIWRPRLQDTRNTNKTPILTSPVNSEVTIVFSAPELV